MWKCASLGKYHENLPRLGNFGFCAFFCLMIIIVIKLNFTKKFEEKKNNKKRKTLNSNNKFSLNKIINKL